MKKLSVLSIFFLLMTLMTYAEDQSHIFQLFSDINEYHRVCYSNETAENQKILNRILSLPYENIGFSVSDNNVINLFDNNGIDKYSSSNPEICSEINMYIKSKFLPEDFNKTENNINFIIMKKANIEKVDPNTCGLFGNEYYVTLEIEFCYTNNDGEEFSTTYSRQIIELVK